MTNASMSVAVVAAALLCVGTGEAADKDAWRREFGSTAAIQVIDVAFDPSGVYLVGEAAGSVAGHAHAGRADVFVRKYDHGGELLWTDQFGSAADERPTAVVAAEGGLYVAGWTTGGLARAALIGRRDAFLRRYDAAGAVSWTDQFGAAGGHALPGPLVADGPGGVHLAGVVRGLLSGQPTRGGLWDIYLRSYAADGEVRWTRQFGSPRIDHAAGLAVDADGLYIGGTLGDGAFLRRYDREGETLWTLPVEGPLDGLAADTTGVYVHGFDGTLRKLAGDGGALWAVSLPFAPDAIAAVGGVLHLAGLLPPEAEDAATRGLAFASYGPSGQLRASGRYGTLTAEAQDVLLAIGADGVHACVPQAKAIEVVDFGPPAWQPRRSPTAELRCDALAASAGAVYLAGATSGNGGSDVFLARLP